MFNLAKLTLSLATSDSLPTSLLEAMACGSIPIFSDVGSISEWIIPGEGGMLVPSGDSKSLETAIIHTLDQPAEWWDHARACNLDIIRQRADRDRELGEAAQDYHLVVSERKAEAVSELSLEDGRGLR